MASKIFQAVLCPTKLFQWKLICTFSQYCLRLLATKFQTDFNWTLLCFSTNSSELCCIDTTFSEMCRTFKRLLSTYRPINISSMCHNRGQDQINALLWYKTTCSEGESRNIDSQWTLVSFLVKNNQFYREARLTCRLYRPSEDIWTGIYVYLIVFLTCGTC